MFDLRLQWRGQTFFRLISLAASITLASCSAEEGRVPVVPVYGALFVEGEPAAGALVIFHAVTETEPKTTNPNGRVQADGSFQLTTYESGDGAPAGDYIVTVFWPAPPKNPTERPDMGPDRLQNRYTNPDTSQIRVTVEPDKNHLHPIRLDGKGGHR